MRSAVTGTPIDSTSAAGLTTGAPPTSSAPPSESRFRRMTNSRSDNPPGGLPVQPGSPAPTQPSSLPRSRSVWDHVLLAIQLVLSLAIAGAVGGYLLFFSGNKSAEEEKRPAPQEELVRVVGPRSIHVQPKTAVSAKLNAARVETAWVTAPVLPVTGTALASLRPGTDRSNDTWQIATTDLLTAFSDWNKAVIDILFQETQLKAIRELSEYRVGAQTKVVAQMDILVKAGTNTQKELFAEQVNLKNFEIQGKK